MVLFITVSFVFFILCDSAQAQLTYSPPVVLGSEIAGTSVFPSNSDSPLPFIQVFTFIPFFEIKIKSNFYLGACYELSFGHINRQKITPSSAIGINANYLLNPFKSLKNSVFNRFVFNTGFSYRLADYFIDGKEELGIGHLNEFSNDYFNFYIGANYNFYKNAYINFGYQFLYYTYNDKFLKGGKIGIQYHFGEKRIKNIKQKRKELKPTDMLDFKNLAKCNLLQSTSVSSSYSFIFDNSVENEIMTLSSVNLALKTAVLEGLEIGYSYSLLFQKNNEQREQFFLHGPFIDINLFKTKSINRGFLTTGFYFGNYNMCVDGNPEKKDGLRYVRLGFGYEHKFFIKNLFFKFHADKYLAVNCGTESSSYLFPFVGFSYYIENK